MSRLVDYYWKSAIFALIVTSVVSGPLDVDTDVEFQMRDGNKDGKVTREEFKRGKPAEATDEAFACLDADMNGYVTKEERDALRTRFWKSRLSQLNAEEVLEWVAYDKCVPADMRKYVPILKAAKLNGLALWDIGVKNPSLLRTEMKIDAPNVRRTLVQAMRLNPPRSGGPITAAFPRSAELGWATATPSFAAISSTHPAL